MIARITASALAAMTAGGCVPVAALPPLITGVGTVGTAMYCAATTEAERREIRREWSLGMRLIDCPVPDEDASVE